MNPPVLDQSLRSQPARRKHSGRLRAYAVASTPRLGRKTRRFRCRNCGQKILVERALRRAAITCPTCQELVPAPKLGRIWLELCAGAILFLAGFVIGHLSASKPVVPTSTAGAVLPGGKTQQAHTKSKPPKPSWFTNNQDGTP